MRNNDINDEDFGKDIDEPNPHFVEAPQALRMFGFVILGCITSILFALTVRLDRWILH